MYKRALLFAQPLLVFLLSIFSFQAIANIPPTENSSNGKIFTLEGSNTIGATLAPTLVKAWLISKGAKNVEIHPLPQSNEYRITGNKDAQSIFVEIHAHGSSTGIKGLLAGTANIAMASRPVKPKEASDLQKKHGNIRSFSAEHIIAIDGLAIVVNPQNPINNIDINTLGKVFSGEITNWSQLGGKNQPINIYARDDKSGTYDTFKSIVLGKKFTLTTQAKRFESNDQLSNSVAKDKTAIGFVGMASINNAKALAVSDAETTALRPETLFVATEDYPLTRRLFMYTPENNNNTLINEFISFTLSPAGQKIVQEIGFVSQTPIKIKVDNVIGPEAYTSLLKQGERLSVNFRFRPGKAEMDNKARHDLLRVVDFIKHNADKNSKIKLVGFSNTSNSDTRADVLSRLRASTVKIALFRHGILADQILALGDENLVANSAGDNKGKNDRVEVWLVTPKS